MDTLIKYALVIKAVKLAVVVSVAIIILAFAAYLTVTAVFSLVIPPPHKQPVELPQSSGTPTPTHNGTFFNYQK